MRQSVAIGRGRRGHRSKHVYSLVTVGCPRSLEIRANTRYQRGSRCPPPCDPVGRSSPGSFPWNFPGENTGVGCHFLLWGSRSQLNVLCKIVVNMVHWHISVNPDMHLWFVSNFHQPYLLAQHTYLRNYRGESKIYC